MTEEQIYRYALRLLAQRDYSPMGLRDKLERRCARYAASTHHYGDRRSSQDRHRRQKIVESSSVMADHDSVELEAVTDEDLVVDKVDKAVVQQQSIDRVVERLMELQLVSEDRFTESFIASKRASGYGPRRIAAQLTSKGIPEGLIQEALDFEDPAWIDQAVHLLQKKMRGIDGVYGASDESLDSSEEQVQPSPQARYKNRAKLIRFLANKGYDHQQIRQALDAFK